MESLPGEKATVENVLSSMKHQEKPHLLICSHKLEYAKVCEKSADKSFK
jgi:hypothetical protein